jgi:hypothetical protein
MLIAQAMDEGRYTSAPFYKNLSLGSMMFLSASSSLGVITIPGSITFSLLFRDLTMAINCFKLVTIAYFHWNDTIKTHTLDKNRVKEMMRKWQTNTQRNSNEKH